MMLTYNHLDDDHHHHERQKDLTEQNKSLPFVPRFESKSGVSLSLSLMSLKQSYLVLSGSSELLRCKDISYGRLILDDDIFVMLMMVMMFLFLTLLL